MVYPYTIGAMLDAKDARCVNISRLTCRAGKFGGWCRCRWHNSKRLVGVDAPGSAAELPSSSHLAPASLDGKRGREMHQVHGGGESRSCRMTKDEPLLSCEGWPLGSAPTR